MQWTIEGRTIKAGGHEFAFAGDDAEFQKWAAVLNLKGLVYQSLRNALLNFERGTAGSYDGAAARVESLHVEHERARTTYRALLHDVAAWVEPTDGFMPLWADHLGELERCIDAMTRAREVTANG